MTDLTTEIPDAERAERAWRDDDPVTAIEAADRALASGTDPEGRAAGVAASAAAADGALSDATARWRRVAALLDGAPAVEAAGRAALAGALTGHIDEAVADLATARTGLADPAPRGLSVLLDGVDAVLAAVRGDLAASGRRLAGLAAATVPADVFAVEPWDELAVAVIAAAGDDATASAMLASHAGPETTRRQLLTAWLALRAGRLGDARAALAAAAGRPALRRNAVLAAAVTVGLARRSGDAAVLAATWHRVAPVVAGADVELLQLDVWGELSAAAALVSAAAGETVAEAMAAAIARAGRPGWCVAVDAWWRLQRALATGEVAAATAAAQRLAAGVPAGGPATGGPADMSGPLAGAAQVWAAVLAGEVDAAAVRLACDRLVGMGRPWEAATLCTSAAAATGDPVAARELLGTGRGLRGRATPDRAAGRDGLSGREREVGLLVLDGLTQREIGARLYISPKTVEQHVARLRQKLAAVNRAELVAGLRARLAVEA